jgi:hypothetical protein
MHVRLFVVRLQSRGDPCPGCILQALICPPAACSRPRRSPVRAAPRRAQRHHALAVPDQLRGARLAIRGACRRGTGDVATGTATFGGRRDRTQPARRHPQVHRRLDAAWAGTWPTQRHPPPIHVRDIATLLVSIQASDARWRDARDRRGRSTVGTPGRWSTTSRGTDRMHAEAAADGDALQHRND